MHNSNADNLTELRRLKQELSDANRVIENLEEKLNLKELRDHEIEKLQKKAQEFEEFMRTNTRSASAASSLSDTKSIDASTETSDFDNDSSRKLRQAETKVRDEMAKIFAGEMKSIEKRFRADVEKLQNRIILITEDLEEKSHELGVRNEQVQLLKFTILQERKEFEKSLNEKDDDLKKVVEKYRVEYEDNQQKVEDLIAQLSEKTELIDEERMSIERLKQQINEERQSIAKRDEETMEKLKKLQVESSKTINELSEKYLTAKQIAANYKQFADDTEKHYRGECERHKTVYTELMEKMEKRCKKSLADKDKSCQEKMKKLESEFDFKVEVYKEMLEKRK